MLAATLALLALQSQPTLARDDYGVPIVKAPSLEEAFKLAGLATAQDRMWQMELSRRVARGRMAEAFGKEYLKADQEAWTQGYTNEELTEQFNKLEPATQVAFKSYAAGVNEFLKAGQLPEGYAAAQLTPEPWTVEDSIAISVLLMRQFGRFGAGELRNLALLAYLDTQRKAKDRKLDVLDDLVWQNDQLAVPTVLPEDQGNSSRPVVFPEFDRQTTEAHAALLPKLNMFELMGGLRIAERVETKRVALISSAPHKAGSYAIVVGKNRSGTGQPILLSGPQMGFTTPSVVHEIVIDCPDYKAAGMAVPGLPGVAVGTTPFFAWGLTSGAADTDDIFFYKAEANDTYTYGSDRRSLQKLPRTFEVKGGEDVTTEQVRTHHGPVVLKGGGHLFVRRAPTWQKEAQNLDALISLGSADSLQEIDQAMKKASANFNFFFATNSGDIGYRYVGHIPVRAKSLDPRLPTPGEPKFEWQGFVPYDQMPQVTNPKSGLIINWNNKPASWWPNGDSPVWGRIFRNSEIVDALQEDELNTSDLENAVYRIARRNETYPFFADLLPQSPNGNEIQANLAAFDGWTLEGSLPAGTYARWLDEVRNELFVPTVGNFISPDLFRLAAGPVAIHKALSGETKLDYLNGRTAQAVAGAALEKVQQKAQQPSSMRYRASRIRFKGVEPDVPYANRGTYIQIVEVGPWGLSGRSVLPPGNSESGDHAYDQVPLARQWTFKPMHRW